MRIRRVLAAAVALTVAAGCGGRPEPRQVGGPGDGTGEITVWYHAAGGPERIALLDQVDRFNALGTGVTVRVQLLPTGYYDRQLAIAATADALPDLFDLDATALPALVRDRAVVPLDGVAGTGDLVPAVADRGTLGGRRYGIGTTETTVALYANRALLAAAGITPPASPGQAWTAARFTEVLRTLAAADDDGKVLDLRLSDGRTTFGRQLTTWWEYGFGPVVWSAGGDLLDADRTAAAGTLDAPAVAAAVAQVGAWRDLVETDPKDEAFRDGRVAFSWASSRNWPSYRRALGRDLAVLPLPDFGAGTKTSRGGWTWSVSTRSAKQRAAQRFLQFLLEPAEVAVTAKAAGAAPGTRTALAADKAYRPGGVMAVPAALLANGCEPGAVSRACSAVPLPATAGWTTLQKEAGGALRDGIGGADPAAALAAAARAIDADFGAHGGYRLP